VIAVEQHRVALSGGALAVVLHVPESSAPAPCVVACHGLGASKDSDKYLLLAEALPAAGLALARFDFRGCGESSGVEDATTRKRSSTSSRVTPAWTGASGCSARASAASSPCTWPPGGRGCRW